jgi:hypothetical protein
VSVLRGADVARVRSAGIQPFYASAGVVSAQWTTGARPLRTRHVVACAAVLAAVVTGVGLNRATTARQSIDPHERSVEIGTSLTITRLAAEDSAQPGQCDRTSECRCDRIERAADGPYCYKETP